MDKELRYVLLLHFAKITHSDTVKWCGQVYAQLRTDRHNTKRKSTEYSIISAVPLGRILVQYDHQTLFFGEDMYILLLSSEIQLRIYLNENQ